MQSQPLWRSGFTRVPTNSLPIYRATCGDRAILYTPRLICVLEEYDAPAALLNIKNFATEQPRMESSHLLCGSIARRAAHRIVQEARNAVREAAEIYSQDFIPECLTVYVNNQCSMRCRYCYSLPNDGINRTVSAEGVRAAAKLIAATCATRNSPFTLAFHGGGEPTLNPRYVDRLLDIVQEEAGKVGLHPRTYIATNGAVSDEIARWLTVRFDLVGVSCDGPPDIQERHRPGRDGQSLFGYVSHTMSTLKQHGRPFHIRTTITRETVARQAEIVSYLADRYAPDEIRLEPVYMNPSGEKPLDYSQAAVFVDGFLAAQTAGEMRGIPVTTSITRPDAIFGPYCNVLRRVLNLIPGDVATGCFLESRPVGAARRRVQLGSLDSAKGEFRLDWECIRSLLTRLAACSFGCADCLCSCQCTFGCPDSCALTAAELSALSQNTGKSFRCLVNRMLMEAFIVEVSNKAWACTPPDHYQEMWDTRRKLTVAVYRNGKEG